jgi:polyhydroxyalkanoate synthesis regulator phasin
MWKKIALILAGVLAVAVLVAGLAAVAYADSGTAAGAPQWGGKLINRVAQILNIDSQKLSDAFKQAGTEMRQQAVTDRFDKWVADGKLTVDQANQYKAWLASKPADVPVFVNQKAIDQLLKDGKITQAQYDAWKGWMAQKPNIQLPQPNKPAGGRFHKGTSGVN